MQTSGMHCSCRARSARHFLGKAQTFNNTTVALPIRANRATYCGKALFHICPFCTHPKALILSTFPELGLQGRNGAPYYYSITSIPDGGYTYLPAVMVGASRAAAARG
jgi:hypothetical protein